MGSKLNLKGRLQLVVACLAMASSLAFIKASDGKRKTADGKTEIRFTDQEWAQTLQQAKKKKQLIFVDANASWCGPCKDLKLQTFTNPKVAAYFNTHFINVSLDMEKGEGLKFADRYMVESYPTLLFIDGDGRVIKKSEGFLDAGELMSLAKTAGLKQ